MSYFMSWLWSKSDDQLKKMKETRLKKIAKLNQEVDAIDKELAKKNESKN